MTAKIKIYTWSFEIQEAYIRNKFLFLNKYTRRKCLKLKCKYSKREQINKQKYSIRNKNNKINN